MQIANARALDCRSGISEVDKMKDGREIITGDRWSVGEVLGVERSGTGALHVAFALSLYVETVSRLRGL